MNCQIKLPSQIFKILKIQKISKNNKMLFKRKKIETKKRNICKRTLIGVYVYKISSRHLEKLPSFGILKVENGHFPRYFLEFLHSPVLLFRCPI